MQLCGQVCLLGRCSWIVTDTTGMELQRSLSLSPLDVQDVHYRCSSCGLSERIDLKPGELGI